MPCQKITGCESMYSRIKGVPLWQEHKWLRYRTGSSQIMLKQGTSGLSSMEDCLFAKSYLKARHSQFWLLVCRKFGTWVITSGCQKVCGWNLIKRTTQRETAKRKEYSRTNAGVTKNSEIRWTGQVFIQEIPNLFIRAKHKAFMGYMLCGPCWNGKSNYLDDAVSHHR